MKHIRMTGPSGEDTALLLRRSKGTPAEARMDGCESWVVVREPGSHTLRWATRGWIGDIWRSPRRTLYLMGHDHIWRVSSDAEGGAENEISVSGILDGIWGLDDDFVLSWGRLRDGYAPALFQVSGTAVTEHRLPAGPQGQLITAVHGSSAANVVVVGTHGLLAHWDGETWVSADMPADQHFAGVHVVDENEAYCCGGGRILRYDGRAWETVCQSRYRLRDVAAFAGRVWAVDPDAGLLALGEQLELIKDNIRGIRLGVEDYLLITCDDQSCGTEDGQRFFGWGIDQIAELLDAHPIP